MTGRLHWPRREAASPEVGIARQKRRFIRLGTVARLAAVMLIGYGAIGASAPLTMPAPANGWTPVGSMNLARADHVATSLPDGDVLVAGGFDNTGQPLASAELYHPHTGTWTLTGAMGAAREHFAATLLPSGLVLVEGGESTGQPAGILASAELYNPATGVWTATGGMTTPRYFQTATLLKSGQVLVAGGLDGDGHALASAELYDPATGVWTATGSMHDPRLNFSLTVLPRGRVLAAGGTNNTTLALSSAEVYEPSAHTWAVVGSMASPRALHTATLLGSGLVLVAGGVNDVDTILASAELFDPTTWRWSAAAPMTVARAAQAATLLRSGRVLEAGGAVLPTAEVYDPAQAVWSDTGRMTAERYEYYTASLLPDGHVLIAGGTPGCGEQCPVLSSAEVYTPSP